MKHYWGGPKPDDFMKVVEGLIEKAKKEPMDAAAMLQRREGVPERFQAVIELDSLPVKISFTLTKLGLRRLWQLSMKDERHTPLPEATVKKIVTAFFPKNDAIEVPSVLYPGIVLQFIKFIESSDEPELLHP